MTQDHFPVALAAPGHKDKSMKLNNKTYPISLTLNQPFGLLQNLPKRLLLAHTLRKPRGVGVDLFCKITSRFGQSVSLDFFFGGGGAWCGVCQSKAYDSRDPEYEDQETHHLTSTV